MIPAEKREKGIRGQPRGSALIRDKEKRSCKRRGEVTSEKKKERGQQKKHLS